MLDDAVGSPRQLRTASPLLRTAGTPSPFLGGSQTVLPTLKHSSCMYKIISLNSLPWFLLYLQCFHFHSSFLLDTPSGQSSIADGDFDLQVGFKGIKNGF